MRAAKLTTALDARDLHLLGLMVCQGNVVKFASSDRIPDWAKIKKMMMTLGGEWRRGVGGFVFPDTLGSIEERLAHAKETGEILDPKLAGFFPTPDGLADLLIAKVAPRGGDRVLEPSAGHGAILDALVRFVETQKRPIPYIWRRDLVCYELLEQNCRVLQEKEYEPQQADFLTVVPPAPSQLFNCIPMNPPFSRGQDIDHVMHALTFLARGGRLAAIMSAGVKFRSDSKATQFRELLQRLNGAIEDLPEKSFQVSGTNVRTVLVTVTA